MWQLTELGTRHMFAVKAIRRQGTGSGPETKTGSDPQGPDTNGGP
jgi:hypothetical protein